MDTKKHGRSEKWRRAHAASMRLHQNRLKRGREIAAKKTPTSAVIKKRANRAALAKLRMKFAGSKGKAYNQLSSSEKVAVDDLVSRNINSKVVRQLTKALVPKIRLAANKKKRHPDVTPVVEPKNHSDKKKVTEGYLRTRLGRKQQATRNRAKNNKFSVGRMSNEKEGGSDAAHSRAATYSVTKANQDIYKTTNDGVGVFGSARREQVKKLRGRTRLTSQRTTNKRNQHRGKLIARARTRSNRGIRKSLKQAGVLRNDIHDAEHAINIMLEDVVQDKIESLFIRGLVPKHLIQRYKRVMNDPKRYIKFRQYHDEILTLFRTLQELLTSDDTIFQKVRQRVMAKNHGRA